MSVLSNSCLTVNHTEFLFKHNLRPFNKNQKSSCRSCMTQKKKRKLSYSTLQYPPCLRFRNHHNRGQYNACKQRADELEEKLQRKKAKIAKLTKDLEIANQIYRQQLQSERELIQRVNDYEDQIHRLEDEQSRSATEHKQLKQNYAKRTLQSLFPISLTVNVLSVLQSTQRSRLRFMSSVRHNIECPKWSHSKSICSLKSSFAKLSVRLPLSKPPMPV